MIAKIRKTVALLFSLICAIIVLPLSIIFPFSYKVSRFYKSLSCFFTHRILSIQLIKQNFNLVHSQGPGIIISNHQDTIDIWVVSPNHFQNNIAYVAKKSLAWIPFIGQVFYLTGNLFIDRRNKKAALKTLDNAKRILKEKDCSIWIMPEGTRTGSKGMTTFKTGAFHMAMELGVPIIPLVISSYSNNLDFNIFKSQKIIIQALKPIPTSAWDKKDIKEHIVSIRELMIEAQKRINTELSSYNV